MASSTSIKSYDNGDVVYITVAQDAIKHYAEIVAPFVAVDYDAQDNIVGFSAAGPSRHAAIEIFNDWLSEQKRPALDAELAKWEQLAVPA